MLVDRPVARGADLLEGRLAARDQRRIGGEGGPGGGQGEGERKGEGARVHARAFLYRLGQIPLLPGERTPLGSSASLTRSWKRSNA